jgi:hypothetical protein
MRTMKMLGLLIVSAMVLVAAVGTSSASAVATFTAGEVGRPLSSSVVEEHAFRLEGLEWACKETTFAGSTEGTETISQLVSPTYKGCKLPETDFTVTMNTGSCKYRFDAETSGEPGHATLKLIDCENMTKGMQMEVNIPFTMRCVVDMPLQWIRALRYSNGSGSYTVTATTTELMASVTTSTGLCPVEVGTYVNGEYSGASEFNAFGGIQHSP